MRFRHPVEADPCLAQRRSENAAEATLRLEDVVPKVEVCIAMWFQSEEIVHVGCSLYIVQRHTRGAPVPGGTLAQDRGCLEKSSVGSEARQHVKDEGLLRLVDGVDAWPIRIALTEGSLAALLLELVLGNGQLHKASMLHVARWLFLNLQRCASLFLQLVEKYNLRVVRGPRNVAHAKLGVGLDDTAWSNAGRRCHPRPHLKSLHEVAGPHLAARHGSVEGSVETQHDSSLRCELDALHCRSSINSDPDSEDPLITQRLDRCLWQQSLLAVRKPNSNEAAHKARNRTSSDVHRLLLLHSIRLWHIIEAAATQQGKHGITYSEFG
mmetsp:Transcript_92075/g.192518  ORF Transcript_92075/g.192518 Transcript_92075/m.192518 type:complete len:324 (-) Transcript_92075:860-1831(-)